MFTKYSLLLGLALFVLHSCTSNKNEGVVLRYHNDGSINILELSSYDTVIDNKTYEIGFRKIYDSYGELKREGRYVVSSAIGTHIFYSSGKPKVTREYVFLDSTAWSLLDIIGSDSLEVLKSNLTMLNEVRYLNDEQRFIKGKGSYFDVVGKLIKPSTLEITVNLFEENFDSLGTSEMFIDVPSHPDKIRYLSSGDNKYIVFKHENFKEDYLLTAVHLQWGYRNGKKLRKYSIIRKYLKQDSMSIRRQ